MQYVFLGVGVIFLIFALWAIINANSFKLPESAKNSPPPPKDVDYVFVKEEKPKKVKIKREEEKIKGESRVEKVFEGEENNSKVEPVNYDEEKEKDELLQKYLNEMNGEKEETKPKQQAAEIDDDDFDAEIERRIAEIRARNGLSPKAENRQSESRDFEDVAINTQQAPAQSAGLSGEPNYYGFGIGLSGHTHGSLKDPNFDPWAGETSSLNQASFNRPIDDNFIIDEDDIDDIAFDRMMRGSMFDRRALMPEGFGPNGPIERRSRIGGGSVSGQVTSRKRPNLTDIIVGDAIGNPPA